MATYYVKAKEADSYGRRYFTDDLPQLKPADGLTEVTVPDIGKYPQYFLAFWADGYYLDEADHIVSPGNLPDLDIGFLLQQIQLANKKYELQASDVKNLQTDLSDANKTVATLSTKLDDANNAVGLANESILELSDMVLNSAPADTATETPTNDTANVDASADANTDGGEA